MAAVTLSVENGRFAYPKGREVLKGVNFAIESGDLLAILGPNGAGKTTLLRCLMGFLKWSQGRALLDGRDIASLPPRQLWQKIAYVPQARSARVSYTVEEMVLLGRGSRVSAFGKPTARDVAVARLAMERLHISALARRRMDELSGGEAQMALIARALAAQPQVLILDEPESNLDFRNQLLVLDAMSALTEQGMTCVFNTHYPAHALRRASKALMLSPDGTTLFGDTHAVVTEQTLRAAFGVRAVIGEVETDTHAVPDVVPLRVEAADAPMRASAGGDRLAVLSLIAHSQERAESINPLLHRYADCIVGRMGMPYRRLGVYVINLTLYGPEEHLRTLSAQLSALEGVSVKAVYSEGRAQP